MLYKHTELRVYILYILPLGEGFSFSARENRAPSKISINTIKVNLYWKI